LPQRLPDDPAVPGVERLRFAGENNVYRGFGADPLEGLGGLCRHLHPEGGGGKVDQPAVKYNAVLDELDRNLPTVVAELFSRPEFQAGLGKPEPDALIGCLNRIGGHTEQFLAVRNIKILETIRPEFVADSFRRDPDALKDIFQAGQGLGGKRHDTIEPGVFEVDENRTFLKVDIVELVDEMSFPDRFVFSFFDTR